MGASAIVDEKSRITLEFQRAKAKELQEYFKQKKLEEADQGPAFGFVVTKDARRAQAGKMQGLHDSVTLLSLALAKERMTFPFGQKARHGFGRKDLLC